MASYSKPKETEMANQGGTHEQPVKPGKQSRKNADRGDRNMSSSGSRDQQGSSKTEQQMKTGRQSNKGKH
jgi:hypothetical protein